MTIVNHKFIDKLWEKPSNYKSRIFYLKFSVILSFAFLLLIFSEKLNLSNIVKLRNLTMQTKIFLPHFFQPIK